MRDITNDLRELIRILVINLGLLEKSEASCCGVTIGQCHAIVEIGRKEEVSLNELANLLDLDKSTMSRTVNNLVKQNLVERKINPEDRRYMKIRLTKEGNEIFREIETGMNSYYKRVLNDIDEEKRGQVIESLHLLIEAIKKNKCC